MPLIAAPTTPLKFPGAGKPAPSPPPPAPSTAPLPEAKGKYKDFIKNHRRIIDYLENTGNSNRCPTKEELQTLGIDKEELDAHIALLIIDKYVAETDERYCTMSVLMRLKESLKRYRE